MISYAWIETLAGRVRRTPPAPAPEPDRPRGLSDGELTVLKYIVRRGGTSAEHARAGQLADGMRTRFTDVDDQQIARLILRTREIVLTRHDQGLNVPQIARLLGLIAAELTVLDRETPPR